ncbi:MAG: DNA internalization-related competence protein ComEC/Rec2 [Sedimentibacter sp.]|uniref:DNA internalization-related competence protein ComEC/Rec2 n=1 Tax=Sedimentibacter sp. TaxID=1960295 RepID=UPI0031597FBE
MYILVSLFTFYAMGIVSYEHGFFWWLFAAVVAVLFFNALAFKKFLYNFVAAVFLLLSALNCYYNSNSVLVQHINENLDFTLRIESENEGSGGSRYSSFNAEVTQINGINLHSHENTIVYVRKNDGVEENSTVKIKGSVSDSEFFKNRMLFSYRNYLRSRKINAVIFAEGSAVTTEKDYSSIKGLSLKFKKYTEKTFYENLHRNNAEILLSVILSDTDYLEEDFYLGIREMGLAHIFAVSGTHVALMYGFLMAVFKMTGMGRRLSWGVSWALIWSYGFLIGFPVSVVRSLVMFTLLFGSEVLYRKYSSLNALGLAALVLTLYNPFWLFDAGFLLSFAAALSLVLFNRYKDLIIPKDIKYLNHLFMYLFLQVFTFPVISYFFNYLPLMGILYNLLLLPVFSVILAWGFLLLIFDPAIHLILKIPFEVLNFVLTTLRHIVYSSEKNFFNGITVRSMTVCETVFFYAAVLLILFMLNNRKLRVRKYIFASLIGFYAVTFTLFPIFDRGIYFNVADAGQGLFATLKYRDVFIIFDCGSTSSDKFGEYTVMPYLVKRGIKSVDCAFISHWDADHFSGLGYLLNSSVNVKNIISSASNEEIQNAAVLNKGSMVRIKGNIIIHVLWPEDGYASKEINNSSMVLAVDCNNLRILLPGDIEEEVENKIALDLTPADIVVVPHHGSSTSSSDSFVKKINASVAVLSYGRNSYGIPSMDVVKRYKDSGSKVLSTFEHGEINFVLKDGVLYYNTYEGENSDNFFKLYFEWIIPKTAVFLAIFGWMRLKKEECYELQDNYGFDRKT